MIIEETMDEYEAPSCTFDDDADPSIERCWASEDDNYYYDSTSRKNNLTGATGGVTSDHPLALMGMGAVIVAAVMLVGGLLVREVRSKNQQNRDGTASSKQVKEQPSGSSLDPRVNELKRSLEREAKEKEGLSEQNNFLKSALEERKATVQMFTSELQVRCDLIVSFMFWSSLC